MRKSTAVTLGLGYFLLIASAPSVASERLYIVKDSQAAATIVIPQPTPHWTSQAAQWLQAYLQESTGATLSIVTEDQAPTSQTIVSIGHTRLAQEAGIKVDDLDWDGCKLQVKDSTLFLIGRDQEKPLKNPNKGAHGTARAVVTFLEDFCGVRWFLPGPEGDWVPQHQDIAVPTGLNEKAVPAFAFSDGRYPYASKFLGDDLNPAALANNFRVGIAANTGGHTFNWLLPPAEYFPDHPEYFALIDGKRHFNPERPYLCDSNPEIVKILLRGIQEKFDEGYDVVSLGQTDGYMRCQCDRCEALDDYRGVGPNQSWNDFLYSDRQGLRDRPADRLFLLFKKIIDGARLSHPDKKILIMSYGPTTWPSKKISDFGDNSWVELSIQEPEVVEAWSGKTRGMTGYVYWFDIQLPMGLDVHATPKELAEKIRFLHGQGFIGMYHFPETAWGLNGPVYYELGKLMGDPYRDYQELVAEYCHGVFEKAGNTMIAFYETLYADREQILTLNQRRPSRIPKDMTTEEIYLQHYTPQRLQRLEQLLTQSESEADSQRACGWLRLVREEFEFAKRLTLLIQAYRQYQQDATDLNLAEVKLRVDAFNQLRGQIINYEKEYADRWFPGHAHYCNFLTADARLEGAVYYKSWQSRRSAALERGVKGLALGYGGGPGYSYVREPLTLDLSQPPM